jgi:hypothetical protein
MIAVCLIVTIGNYYYLFNYQLSLVYLLIINNNVILHESYN